LKKAHIFTGPLLMLLVNFRCPPSKLKFAMPPPPEFGIEGVHPQLKYRPAASFTSLAADEMAPSLKNILDWL
jgi:hypothetical protein